MSTKKLIAVCAVVVIAAAYLTMKAVIRGEEIAVPKVVEMRPAQAQMVLEGLRLGLKERERQFHEKIPDGYIIEQDPPAGELIKRGRTVWVITSKGSMTVTVPEVKDQLQRQATLNLQAKGLTVGRVSRVHQSLPADTVLAQTPDVGALVPTGSPVSMLVSAGPFPVSYVMPDFVGVGAAKAKQWMAGAGIVRKKISMQTSDLVSDGAVMAQVPPAGAMVRPEEIVELTVNAKSVPAGSGVRMVTVTYDVPKDAHVTRHVKMVVADDDGQREIYNELKEGGSRIKFSTRVVGEASIEVFLDNDAEPVETIQQ